jgi:hypothetical protein
MAYRAAQRTADALMTGRLRQGEAVFSNHVFLPVDRAPCGLSVMDSQQLATEGYSGRGARDKPAPFAASIAANTGESLKVAGLGPRSAGRDRVRRLTRLNATCSEGPGDWTCGAPAL